MRSVRPTRLILALLLTGCSMSTRLLGDADASIDLPGEDAGVRDDASSDLDAAASPPVLTRLDVSSGSLSSPLSANDSSYEIEVPLTTQTITLTLDAPSGATIVINGEVIAAGTPWSSPVLTLGNNEITIVVSSPGHESRTYTVRITRGGPIAYIKASNTSEGAAFGWSVAISGDTLAVGAPYDGYVTDMETGLASDTGGATYVFVNRGGAWSQQAYLKASNAEASDLFGYDVAISGDTILIGAPNESSNARGVNGDQNDNSATLSGAGYVFVRRDDAWSQQAYLKASNADAQDHFGAVVAISDDTIVVTAADESSAAHGINGDQSDNSVPLAGAAYVFVRHNNAWSQQAYLKGQVAGDRSFGGALALAGSTLAVAGESSSEDIVQMLERVGDVWTQTDRLGSGDLSTHFGTDLALHGETLLVGAPQPSSWGRGEVFVFVRQDVGWMEQARLRSPEPRGGTFGQSVGLFGDVAVIGFPAGGDDNYGAGYVFTRERDVWTQQLCFNAADPPVRTNYVLGQSVAISETAIVFGSPGEASDATGINGDESNQRAWGSGAVYALSSPL